MAKVLVGICGSITAYRSPDFIRDLKAQGHELRVVLTSTASQFVTTKTLETFLGSKVLSNDLWNAEHLGTDHIEGARWADVIVVYGATVNFMAKLRQGFCDDFLTLQISATQAPVVLCPAMNVVMWESPANQENFQSAMQSWNTVAKAAGLAREEIASNFKRDAEAIKARTAAAVLAATNAKDKKAANAAEKIEMDSLIGARNAALSAIVKPGPKPIKPTPAPSPTPPVKPEVVKKNPTAVKSPNSQ